MDRGGHGLGYFSEFRTHGRGEVKHFHPPAVNTDIFKDIFNVGDFLTAFQISFQEMAFTLQSAGHIDTVGALLHGLQQVHDVHSSGAGHLNHLDAGWIGESHGTGQIRCSIRTVAATKGQNLRFKVIGHNKSS
jgi:hypothetical protein